MSLPFNHAHLGAPVLGYVTPPEPLRSFIENGASSEALAKMTSTKWAGKPGSTDSSHLQTFWKLITNHYHDDAVSYAKRFTAHTLPDTTDLNEKYVIQVLCVVAAFDRALRGEEPALESLVTYCLSDTETPPGFTPAEELQRAALEILRTEVRENNRDPLATLARVAQKISSIVHNEIPAEDLPDLPADKLALYRQHFRRWQPHLGKDSGEETLSTIFCTAILPFLDAKSPEAIALLKNTLPNLTRLTEKHRQMLLVDLADYYLTQTKDVVQITTKEDYKKLVVARLPEAISAESRLAYSLFPSLMLSKLKHENTKTTLCFFIAALEKDWGPAQLWNYYTSTSNRRAQCDDTVTKTANWPFSDFVHSLDPGRPQTRVEDHVSEIKDLAAGCGWTCQDLGSHSESKSKEGKRVIATRLHKISETGLANAPALIAVSDGEVLLVTAIDCGYEQHRSHKPTLVGTRKGIVSTSSIFGEITLLDPFSEQKITFNTRDWINIMDAGTAALIAFAPPNRFTMI